MEACCKIGADPPLKVKARWPHKRLDPARSKPFDCLILMPVFRILPRPTHPTSRCCARSCSGWPRRPSAGPPGGGVIPAVSRILRPVALMRREPHPGHSHPVLPEHVGPGPARLPRIPLLRALPPAGLGGGSSRRLRVRVLLLQAHRPPGRRGVRVAVDLQEPLQLRHPPGEALRVAPVRGRRGLRRVRPVLRRVRLALGGRQQLLRLPPLFFLPGTCASSRCGPMGNFRGGSI